MAEYHALGGAPATWMYAARIQLCLVKGATWRRLGRGRFQLAEAEPGRTRLGGGATGEREGEVRVGEGEGEAEGRQRVALRQLARARELWQEMRARGLQADKYAASAMIAVCGRAGRADEAERVMAGVALGGRRVVGEAVLGGRRVVGEAMLGGRRVVGEAMLGGTWEGEAVLEGTGVGGQVEPGKVSSGAGVAADARSRDAGMGGFNSGLNGGWKSGFNDVVVWNALADAWSRSGDAVRSEGVLSRMLHAHCPPNLRSYNIVLNAYAKSITPVSAHGDYHTSEHVNEGRGEMRVIRHNDRREEQWANGLMRGDGWLTHGGRRGSSPSVPPRLSPSETIHRMRQLIASMSRQESPPWPSNAARCTSRQDLAACVTRSSKSTLDAVTPCTTTSATVTPDAVTPDIVTFNTLLDACARAADADAAVDTWQQMIGSGITPTELYTFSCNHLFPLSLPPSSLSLPNRPIYPHKKAATVPSPPATPPPSPPSAPISPPPLPPATSAATDPGLFSRLGPWLQQWFGEPAATAPAAQGALGTAGMGARGGWGGQVSRHGAGEMGGERRGEGGGGGGGGGGRAMGELGVRGMKGGWGGEVLRHGAGEMGVERGRGGGGGRGELGVGGRAWEGKSMGERVWEGSEGMGKRARERGEGMGKRARERGEGMGKRAFLPPTLHCIHFRSL
ncbi:unnamed protein product [Closterium sp. Naga37s-1]|nr:unnamed protein product [Closterium sp. Naga37s-1]